VLYRPSTWKNCSDLNGVRKKTPTSSSAKYQTSSKAEELTISALIDIFYEGDKNKAKG